MNLWQRWVRQPRNIWLRRAFFQAHLWSGVALGLYILMMSVTGSVLVYANELYVLATPPPVVLQSSGPAMSDGELARAAARVYPGYNVVKIGRTMNPDQAVDVWLRRGGEMKQRLFDPRSGADLGESVPGAIRVVSRLIDLHDNLFAGTTGRKVNAIGACALLVLAATGLAIWWPGIGAWKRSLTWQRGVGWKRATWHLHSMIGFWSLGLLVMFGLSGAYLSLPQPFQDLADRIQPATTANAGIRFVDKAIYWLAFVHFGRINGIGIGCGGAGACDQAVKAMWAAFGLAPAAMFATGAIVWWNRVLRPRLARRGFGRGVGWWG